MNIKLTADATCDLTAELVEKLDVELSRLYVIMGEKEFRDGLDAKPEDIFKYVFETGKLSKSSACNVAEYSDMFAKFADDYDAVIHISLSSKISATYQNAVIAAESFDNVYVVDSCNLSTGCAHLIFEADRLRKTGMDAKDIADALEEFKTRVEVSFVLDTLDYLAKGGRCSALAALGANILKLKPSIEVKDGAMGVGKKYRGTLESSLLEYVKDHIGGRNDLEYDRIFITSTCLSDELPKKVEAKVRELQPKFKEIIHTKASSVIANHCGPDCLGILYVRKKA